VGGIHELTGSGGSSGGSFLAQLERTGYNLPMVNWRRFTPADFEYDFDADKLAAHRVTFQEAVECFFSDFEVRRNKSYTDRFQLIGITIGGRQLKVIFQLKPNQIVRIITGWPL
jgi:uncharacterized DUF497 family protein